MTYLTNKLMKSFIIKTKFLFTEYGILSKHSKQKTVRFYKPIKFKPSFFVSVIATLAITTSLTSKANAKSSNMQVYNEAYQTVSGNINMLDAPSNETKQFIKNTLKQAGMTDKISAIEPSLLPSMYQVTLVGNSKDGKSKEDKSKKPLHITADGKYVLQGKLEPNPSPQLATPPYEPPSLTRSGMPVSDKLRQAFLANVSEYDHIKSNVPLYYTSVPGVLWGITFEKGPFLTNTHATVFTDGEISIIKNGQFAGLDGDFEKHKNSHILSHLDENQLIIYPAKTREKQVIYVATDINCPYCRELHSKIDEFNAKGITIKTIGYQVYEESYEPMRQIWCAEDNKTRQLLLDMAMKGKQVPTQCESPEVNNFFANQSLADGLAVYATPAIYREDGVQFQGTHNDPNFLKFLGIK